MHPYFLSIVMPVFNEETIISRVVEDYAKILENFQSKEFIIVNDCSTDGTPQILDRLAGVYPYLNVVHSPKNQGHGPSLMHAYRMSKGDYVFHSDSDNQFVAEDFWLLWDRLQQN